MYALKKPAMFRLLAYNSKVCFQCAIGSQSRTCHLQGLTLSSATRASLDVSNGMVGASAPCAAMLGSLVGAHSGEMGFIADKHQRNAVIGHTLGLIEAQLDALR